VLQKGSLEPTWLSKYMSQLVVRTRGICALPVSASLLLSFGHGSLFSTAPLLSTWPLLLVCFGASQAPTCLRGCPAGGQILSAIVGCTVRVVLGDVIWLSAALAMSLALLVMILTGTTHPPGAASRRLYPDISLDHGFYLDQALTSTVDPHHDHDPDPHPSSREI